MTSSFSACEVVSESVALYKSGITRRAERVVATRFKRPADFSPFSLQSLPAFSASI
jgi:hypothetical protein